MKNYLRLLSYIRPYTKTILTAIFCIVVAAGSNLYVPWIIKDMIDKVLAEKDMEMLNYISIGIVVVFLIRGIFYFGQSYLVSYVGQRVVIDIRGQLYRKFQRLPLAYYDKHRTGEMMSYISNDVAALQNAMVDKLIELITDASHRISTLCSVPTWSDHRLTEVCTDNPRCTCTILRKLGRVALSIYRLSLDIELVSIICKEVVA